jgi:hypothetical protein
LRHLNRFLTRHPALVIFAIGEQDDCPSRRDRRLFLIFEQLVAACAVERIEQSGAAAGP